VTKTLTYSLVIEAQDDEAGYLAYFPTLHGCNAWGGTYEKAVKNAEEALLGYLEALQLNGQSIPRETRPTAEVSLGLMVTVPAMV
jgi:predicted RNase H-like HicB family nuclease